MERIDDRDQRTGRRVVLAEDIQLHLQGQARPPGKEGAGVEEILLRRARLLVDGDAVAALAPRVFLFNGAVVDEERAGLAFVPILKVV